MNRDSQKALAPSPHKKGRERPLGMTATESKSPRKSSKYCSRQFASRSCRAEFGMMFLEKIRAAKGKPEGTAGLPIQRNVGVNVGGDFRICQRADITEPGISFELRSDLHGGL